MITQTESPLADQRAEAIFDMLVIRAVSERRGATKREMLRHLVAEGLMEPGTHPQVVTDALTRLRKMWSADNDGNGHDIVVCNRSGSNSTYMLALSPDEAVQYRKARARHISSEIKTLVAQVKTESEKFGGQRIFTEAAIDYFERGLAELQRAASLELMSVP